MQTYSVHRKENKKEMLGDWHSDYPTNLFPTVCSKGQMGDLNVHELSSLLNLGHIPPVSYGHIISSGQVFANGVEVKFYYLFALLHLTLFPKVKLLF